MMTHPLTDDTIHTMWGKGDPSQKFEYRLARSAADWQLERVKMWLIGRTSDYLCEDYSRSYFDKEELLDDLEIAMRPQQQENN